MGLFRVATGDGQPTACIAASLVCCMLGVPGQDWEGSWRPAEVGVRVRVWEEEEEEEDAGDDDSVTSV